NLGAFSGTIYIGILAYSGCGNNMNIDYVRLMKSPQYINDVGVEAIIQPISTHTINSQMTPIARIRNFGTATQTNFSASCSILGISSELLSKIQNTEQLLKSDLLSLLSNADYVVRYADTVRISSLASSETTRVNFRTWTPTIVEPCIIRIRTNLSTDQNPYNNFKDQITSITQYQYLIVEGFNDTTFPPPGWQSVIINGSYNWERKTSNEDPDCLPYEGTAMASYQSYSASAGSMARLKSPPITLGPTPVPCNLKFFMYHDPGYSSCPDSVKIEYSTDGTNFTRVTAFWRYAQTTGWKEHQVYLGTFSGTIYIGILAYSGYGNNMNIDYVRLYQEIPLANDVGVARIISPGSCHIPNTLMPITVWVKNYGNNPQTNFPVTCSVIGTAKTVRYTNTVYITTTLAPNDSIQVNVGSYTPTVSEICSLIVRTNLTNDQYPANDRKVQLTNIGSHFLLLSEGFNNMTFPPSGWQSVIINGNYNWQRKSYNENPECYPYEGSGMASYPCWDASAGSNARLISPALNFGTVPIACSLKFYMYHDTGWSDCYDYVRVEYSTNGVNFIPVDSFLRYQPGPPAWAEHSIALGSFTGTFWLGIVGYSDYGNNINIDNVRLTGRTITDDVGIDAIIYPSTQHTVNTPMIPIARVKNYGSATQNNFQVICSIVGTGTEKMFFDLQNDTKTKIDNITDIVRYVDTLRVTSLAPNETTRVSFRSWTPTIPEQCTIKIRTNLSGDQNPANDQKTQTTLIQSVYTITYPNGGEIWAGGTNQQIKWHRPAPILARHLLLLSRNSGVTYSDTIADNISPFDTIYNWSVPMLNLNTCRVMLQVIEVGGAIRAQDASDADFTIDSEAPSIPLLISPANNTYIRDSMPRFIWHKSTDTETNLIESQQNYRLINEAFDTKRSTDNFLISSIAQYQLQYATNSNFTG
ncbi:MAG: choice-of-anchor J domain-containing protein, partial [candidate division WOR-3 bacterium]